MHSRHVRNGERDPPPAQEGEKKEEKTHTQGRRFEVLLQA